MEENDFLDTVKNITRIILQNDQGMIREDDLKNLSRDFDFEKVISQVYTNLRQVGFELISSRFLNQKYYILTSEGKDDAITPSQYGTLAFILALGKEVDENITIEDLKEMFSEVWESDVQFLIQQGYLRKMTIDNLEIVKVTPLGKAILKNVIQNLDLKNLIEIFENQKEI
ncbi:MAG: hypothetical protein EU548_00725 [Promethearchaeota archaeon]|nr:MAG: hypothetical protein EU548_00725 [Candidatus Lokiarchaeota archaeon]